MERVYRVEDFRRKDLEDLEPALSDASLDKDGFITAPDVLMGTGVKHGDVWLQSWSYHPFAQSEMEQPRSAHPRTIQRTYAAHDA
jgi:hypothetical protein